MKESIYECRDDVKGDRLHILKVQKPYCATCKLNTLVSKKRGTGPLVFHTKGSFFSNEQMLINASFLHQCKIYGSIHIY